MFLRLMNDDEALRIASNLEREGYSFYTAAARGSKNPTTRQVFTDLAKAEKRHLELFEGLRAGLPKKGGEPWWGEEDELVSRYLSTLIDTGVFTQPEKKEKATQRRLSDSEALKMGIQTEKDSILFFTEASKLCKNPKGKRAFRTLIEEEKRHLSDLARRLKTLIRTSNLQRRAAR